MPPRTAREYHGLANPCGSWVWVAKLPPVTNSHLQRGLAQPAAGWPNPRQVVFSANGHYVRLIRPLPLSMEPPGSIYDFEANKSVELMDLPISEAIHVTNNILFFNFSR